MWPFPYLGLILVSCRVNSLHAFWPHSCVTAAVYIRNDTPVSTALTIPTSPRPGSLCVPLLHTLNTLLPPLVCLVQASHQGSPTRRLWLLA
ncbi:hypothetical protein BKA70DRAFT_1330968 [Coprinopsis sp. MPI-PUGE-AT-0042]|nr:hypothetical protein BKA70DRAFT_1330968 [Coprinopsis sp. MPI-PUGE-AT-0042]